MKTRNKRGRFSWIGALMVGAVLVFGFQNCSPGFDVLNVGANSLGAASDDIPLDPSAPLSVYARSVTVKQGEDLTFKIELNRPSLVPVVVNFKTESATAMAAVDFVESVSAVTIPVGVTSATVTVLALNFAESTADKSLNLILTSASVGGLGQAKATGTIQAHRALPKKLVGVVQTAVGYTNACALLTTGGVKCWGSNFYGELGNNSLQASLAPVDVVGLTGAKSISSGNYHSCVITAQDTVKCWGSNMYGQLGDGTFKDALAPVDVIGLTGIKQIAIGEYHSCALTAQNTIKCWGYNYDGQIGDGTTDPKPTPFEFAGLSGVQQVATTYSATCALLAAGNVKCWGNNFGGQLGDGTSTGSKVPVDVIGLNGAKQIAGGSGHVCALLVGNTVKCWGYNAYGELGNGATTTSETGTLASDVLGLTGVASISAGAEHTCALLLDGTGRCWGHNLVGSLGNKKVENSALPVIVSGLKGATQIASRMRTNCALLADATAVCWGSNSSGQLGNSLEFRSELRLDLPGMLGIKKFTISEYSFCGVTNEKTVKCAGGNGSGQIGGAPSPVEVKSAVVVGGIADAVNVQIGFSMGCATTSTGAVKCWGANEVGQLGNGTEVASPTAADVIGISGIKQLAMGSQHVCILTAQDTVKCWGQNARGQLGNGTLVNSSTPTDVAGLTDVQQLASGLHNTCALLKSGTVQCWGANFYGKLGRNTFDTTSIATSPGPVLGLTGVKQITAGRDNFCVLTATNTVQCWGSGLQGRLGNGQTTPQASPVDVIGLANVKSISTSGLASTCATLADASTRCWGSQASWFGKVPTSVNSALAVEVVAAVQSEIAINELRMFQLDKEGRLRRAGALDGYATEAKAVVLQ